jgi:hypothetical protein
VQVSPDTDDKAVKIETPEGGEVLKRKAPKVETEEVA